MFGAIGNLFKAAIPVAASVFGGPLAGVAAKAITGAIGGEGLNFGSIFNSVASSFGVPDLGSALGGDLGAGSIFSAAAEAIPGLDGALPGLNTLVGAGSPSGGSEVIFNLLSSIDYV
jgi:hypothetical protein